MAIIVTPNLTTFSLADDNTGGTWAGASAAFDTEVNIQGTACWFYQTGKNTIGDGNFIPTTSVDMSGIDAHLYWWMRCDVMPFCELLNTGATSSGLTIKVESSATDYVQWHIAGRDTWGGEWKNFVIDLSNTANIYLTAGTLNLAAVTKVSWLTDNSNSGTIRIIDNTAIDAVRFGTGLTLTGTTFSLLDAALDDELSANMYGVLQILDGNIHCQGRIIIGNGATTTTFNSTDEEIVYKDVLVSSTLYKYDLTGSGNVSVIKGFVAKGAGLATYHLDCSDATADVTIAGSTFIRAGLIDFNSASDIQTSVFNNCKQIVPSTGIFKGNTISNFIGTDGAMLYPTSDTNVSGLSFINCDNGVEYDATSDSTTPGFDDFTFDDEAGNYDVNNTSGATVSIGNINGSNANSYNPAGDIVIFLANPVTLSFVVQDGDGVKIQNARILATVSSGGFYPFEEVVTITRLTTVASVVHTAHGMINGDKVVIEDAEQNDYNGVKTISNVTTNGYDYTVANDPTTPATGTIIATTAILSDLTDINGELSDTRTYSVDQPLGGRVRKSTSSPFYKTSPIVGTLDKDLGKDFTIIMLSDE